LNIKDAIIPIAIPIISPIVHSLISEANPKFVASNKGYNVQIDEIDKYKCRELELSFSIPNWPPGIINTIES
jgi:hypothetical protein